LGTPQQAGAHTKKRTSEGGETEILSVVVTEVGSHVDRVADSAKGQSSADSELVGEGSGEESDDGKRRVQSRVRLVVCGGVKLASSAHTVQRIEHARAHEADEGHDDQLHWWRGKPWKFVAQECHYNVVNNILQK
jgi:hypothetical protein